MKQRTKALWLAATLLLAAGAPARGDEGSVRAAIAIEADSAIFDEQQGQSTYTGNVIITQAGLKIRANTVTVFSENKQLQRLEARGEPVHFRQQRSGAETILGEARQLDYRIDTEHLLLQDQAWFTQGKSRFSGQRIEYDMLKKRVTATQGKDGGQRVKVTLQPRAKAATNDGADTP